MSSRTPLSKATGLGSAKTGASHWWVQRLTAIALLPLTAWFAFAVALLGSTDYAIVVSWISDPVVSVLLVTLIIVSFYHLALGMEVIFEDYIHTHWLKLGAIIVMHFGSFILAVAAVLAVLRIGLAGSL